MARNFEKGETLHQWKERIIDPISESYCAAKWYNATIWLGHGQTASCHHPPGHKIPIEELKDNPTAIHNTQHKKKLRQMMLKGERPHECEYCWKIEDMGKNHISDRTFKTEIVPEHLIKKSSEMPWDADVTLTTLEISFDRACNFKCSYCNPGFSTAWVKDINDYGPYLDINSDGRGHFINTSPWAEPPTKKQEDNPYIQAFHQWWEEELSETLEEIRITGGEPIMHPGTWRLFDWFEQNPDKGRQMRFAINSNLCPDSDKMLDKLILKSRNVTNLEIYTSNESLAAPAEYIRDGLDYERWMKNIHRVLKETSIKKLTMMMTINSLCLPTVTEFMDEMLDLRNEYGRRAPHLSVNILRFPSFQSAAILPPEIKTHYKEKIENWYNGERPQRVLDPIEKASIERLIDYLDIVKTPHKNTSQTEVLYKDFKTFYTQYDIRRGKNFRKTFEGPIADWFDSIEAETPSAKSILNKEFVTKIYEPGGDPASYTEYGGGDDAHEKEKYSA